MSGLLLAWLTATPAAAQVGPKPKEEHLEVTEWLLNTTGEFVELIGRLRNIGMEPLSDVVIFVNLMDSQGRNFWGGQVLMTPATLEPGGAASFKTESWKRNLTRWDTERNAPDIARVTFRFRTTGGKWLNGKYSSTPGSSAGSSQLKALSNQADERFAERRRQEAVDRERSNKFLPAWWVEYETVMKPLRSAERALRAAYRDEGHPGAVAKEIRALRAPLMSVAQKLKPAPDPEVQNLVGNMLLSLASAIEKADGGANVGFREDYARAINLLRQLDKRRAATP